MMVTIQATISADTNKTWDFYTKPEHIIHWNFASDDWCCPTASNDMQVGGKYHARMEAKDGSFGFDFQAIYTDIKIGKEFSYRMLDDRETKVQFSETKNGTEIVVTFAPENENPIEMQRDGWQAILDNFKKYVASTK